MEEVTARAGSYQDYADGKLCRKLKYFCKSKSQQRHYGKLCDTADDHIFWTAEYNLEVVWLQGKSHTEHYDSKQGVDVAGLDEANRVRCKECKCGNCDYDHCHVLADKVCDFLSVFPFWFPPS